MLRIGAAGIAAVALLAACGTSTTPSATVPLASPVAISPTASPPATQASQPTTLGHAIVGVWQGEHDCQGIADTMTAAGFDTSVILENIVGNGLVPGVDDPATFTDLAAACEEAVALDHSHEFTADGRFFSYDENGEEVDFGTYQLVDEDTLAIGPPGRPGVNFDFALEGDHLTLEPTDVPTGCQEFVCQWSVMVAMPWSGMDRVE